MTAKPPIKLVHAGVYVAEVNVTLTYAPEGWEPYLSLGEAQKLDYVREALRCGDVITASRMARVFRLVPVAA